MAASTVAVAQYRGSVAYASATATHVPTASVWDSVYTDSQSTRGDTLFKTTCAKCHGANLAGTDSAVALSGADFLSNWDGLSLDQLYDKILTTMPSDKPNTLAPGQVSDVLAFVLSKSGFPSGKNALPADPVRLKDIKFQKAKP
jgi:mono/diheme cytochrome c family protein